MVCELLSIGYKILGNASSWIVWIEDSWAPQTTDLLFRFYPQEFIHQVIILKLFCYNIFYAVCFPLCSFYCHILYKKSRVIKFWGFFMYLLFLGIVQNNTMKLDNALIQIGKLCFGKNWVMWYTFPSFLPRAFHWNGITDFQNSLQVRQLNSKLELFHSLFVYRAKSWYTV